MLKYWPRSLPELCKEMLGAEFPNDFYQLTMGFPLWKKFGTIVDKS